MKKLESDIETTIIELQSIKDVLQVVKEENSTLKNKIDGYKNQDIERHKKGLKEKQLSITTIKLTEQNDEIKRLRQRMNNMINANQKATTELRLKGEEMETAFEAMEELRLQLTKKNQILEVENTLLHAKTYAQQPVSSLQYNEIHTMLLKEYQEIKSTFSRKLFWKYTPNHKNNERLCSNEDIITSCSEVKIEPRKKVWKKIKEKMKIRKKREGETEVCTPVKL